MPPAVQWSLNGGPLVYCLEAVDNEGMERSGDLRIDPQAPLDDMFEASLLGWCPQGHGPRLDHRAGAMVRFPVPHLAPA